MNLSRRCAVLQGWRLQWKGSPLLLHEPAHGCVHHQFVFGFPLHLPPAAFQCHTALVGNAMARSLFVLAALAVLSAGAAAQTIIPVKDAR